ncbi:hypothetical protein AJ88_22175 [Mesorhizobium amorphae CCBAU 01583]|nr:hypothetical protein AJ88_22175 [Mesorhizobium amorphae CCBAU 01583]
MAWNLLMNSYDRRIGYAWIEFGRIAEDGTPRFLSLGAGLSATVARPQVDSWFFLLEDADNAPRINQDLWLTSAQRVVLTKERLRDALDGRGQVFDTAASYRRAVDERLFHLGAKRYDALMDTLIQLRQPQLSRKPDETALSNALTEALPPLAPELLGDVAEALGQLEEDRRQLDEYQALAKAVGRFEERYRVYAVRRLAGRRACCARPRRSSTTPAGHEARPRFGSTRHKGKKRWPGPLTMMPRSRWRAVVRGSIPCAPTRRCRTPIASKTPRRRRRGDGRRCRGPRWPSLRQDVGWRSAPRKPDAQSSARTRPNAHWPICDWKAPRTPMRRASPASTRKSPRHIGGFRADRADAACLRQGLRRAPQPRCRPA